MCNKMVIDFIKELTEKEVCGLKVLEVGSKNVNGSVRPAIMDLGAQSYTGIDFQNGPGVDVVCDAKDLIKMFGPDSFDIVVSTETLEHVKDLADVLHNMKTVLRAGGLMVITAPSKNCKMHNYPKDYWRFELEDLKEIFSDFNIEVLKVNPNRFGSLLKAKKPLDFKEKDLTDFSLYSIISNKTERIVPKIDMVSATKTLDEIGVKCGTRKSSIDCAYLGLVEKRLPERNKDIALIEIGIYRGESMKMWEEYFTSDKSKFYGIDKEPRNTYKSNRAITFFGGQQDRVFLQSVVDKTGQVDVIIDDGGHFMDQQQISFGFLFKWVKPGGLYILEDLITSSGKGRYKAYNPTKTKNTTLSVLNVLRDTGKINSEFITNEEALYIQDNFAKCEVEIGKYSRIAFIRKK